MTIQERPGKHPSEPATKRRAKPSGLRRVKSKGFWGFALAAAAALGMAAAAGYLAGQRRADSAASPGAPAPEPAKQAGPTRWTCSMHPQINLPNPGKCPICFMDLIPLASDGDDEGGPRRLKMSEASMALASIQTTPVERKTVTRVVRMVGKVDYDETRLVDSTAWISGRLDRMYVDYTGVAVRKGDHLFQIYSPQLVVGQDELLLALRAYQQSTERAREEARKNLTLAEEKLRLWGLLDEQIEEIKRRGKASDHITIYAPAGGVVIRKHCKEGAYVQTGTPVYTIADLKLVWVYLDAYESDLAWLRYGQEVEFTTESYPGVIFTGRIAFIDPVLDEKTRTVKVRVNVPNDDLRLKPGMFVRATVRSRLASEGRVLDAKLAGKLMCPMHPEIVKDRPPGAAAAGETTHGSEDHRDHGQAEQPTCDLCGMDLVPAEEMGFIASEDQGEAPLVIPASAPLITGKRAVVYVKLPDRRQPTFEGREVVLGHRAGDYYIVRDGLREGEEVVTHGSFKIDSALQIKASPSMMNIANPYFGHKMLRCGEIQREFPAAAAPTTDRGAAKEGTDE